MNLPPHWNIPTLHTNFNPNALHKGGMSINKSNSYDVKRDWPKIRQGSVEEFEPLWAFFDEKSTSFGIDYRIVADNMREIITGKLNVVVTD